MVNGTLLNRSGGVKDAGHVLSRPSRLEIRGEYRTGDDVGAMDRFVLTSRH